MDFRPTSKVELTISCNNLLNKDVFSKSDPMVVVYLHDPNFNKLAEIGRTETISNNLNPQFSKKVQLNYFFEEMQPMRFDVYDVDNISPNLQNHDFLGSCECKLSEIVSSCTIERSLLCSSKPNKKGMKLNSNSLIIINAEEIDNSSNEELNLCIYATKLDNKDLFGKSDAYLEFWRQQDQRGVLLHRTEVIKNNLNPRWKPFTLSLRNLCHISENDAFTIKCFDWDDDGSADFIGECQLSVKSLRDHFTEFELINQKKASKNKKYKNSGILHFQGITFTRIFSFLDFIMGGTEISCIASIDFTGSNGDPRQPGTLHFQSVHQPSQYALAIQSVVEILQDYDSDNLYPCFGFGAKVPSANGAVSHCFALNFNESNPFCNGVAGILQAYSNAIYSLVLYGPTNFAPTIHTSMRQANSKMDGSMYTILLIITDGVITDMEATKDAIVQASVLPMSIIIVGVGQADFSAMNELDSDNGLLLSHGRQAMRDIVQFVPFRDYQRFVEMGDITQFKRALSKAVLAEVPKQLEQYMKGNRIQPKPHLGRINRNRNDVVGAHQSEPVQTPSCYPNLAQQGHQFGANPSGTNNFSYPHQQGNSSNTNSNYPAYPGIN